MALLILGISFSVWHRSHVLGGLIDIDDAPPLSAEFKVDINVADWPEIVNLPGIGVKLARGIVQHRHQHGAFESKEQLMEVHGIGQSKLDGISQYLLPIKPVERIARSVNEESKTDSSAIEDLKPGSSAILVSNEKRLAPEKLAVEINTLKVDHAEPRR